MRVPDNFPRRTLSASVGGAALKYTARKADDGSYTTLVSDEEHEQAYENAEDLAQQLKIYALRKERENPDWSREFNLNRIQEGIKSKVRTMEWDFTSNEQDWIMYRLTYLLE